MYTYEYDAAGNILRKNTYALTASWDEPSELVASDIYGYGNADWGGQLTSYNGDTIRYDAIGNPLRYSNGNRWSFTWEHGRRLAQAEGNGYPLSFTYNDEGIRTSKTVNGVVHTYRLNGSQIVAEEWTATDDYGTTAEHMILFLYDAEGTPVGMQYRNQTYAPEIFDVYWFEKNLQGDVVAVYDEDGDKLISYIYDAWGNFTTTYHNGYAATSTANYNPFRYRSYYYDAELEMYYLQSRYYDPVIGRFINADSQLSTGDFSGLNLFAYCGNNPVNRVDPNGHAWYHWAIGAAIVAGFAIATVVTCGGFAAAVTAVGLVSSGIALSSATATAVTAAFIGSATVYGTAALVALGSSSSLQDFADQGNWGTVLGTAFAAGLGALNGWQMYRAQTPKHTNPSASTNDVSPFGYPGNDPSKCDIPGFEWRGKGPAGSGQGNFYNAQTKQWLHPDLNHGGDIGPHWDFGTRGSDVVYRIFPDGTMKPK